MPTLDVNGQPVPLNRLTIEQREAAALLRVELREVRNMLRRGELSNASAGGRRRVVPEELLALIERRIAADELSHVALVEFARLIRTPTPIY